MSDLHSSEALHDEAAISSAATPTVPVPCGECQGSGGWFRYEPALEPLPGLLYLSCLQCRGQGHTAS